MCLAQALCMVLHQCKSMVASWRDYVAGGRHRRASPGFLLASESKLELCERSIEGIRVAENDGGSTEHRSHPKSRAAAGGQIGTFARSGEYWTLGYGDT